MNEFILTGTDITITAVHGFHSTIVVPGLPNSISSAFDPHTDCGYLVVVS